LSAPAWWNRAPRSRFAAGVLCGIVLVVGGRFLVNRTAIADWLVAPLLVTDSPGAAQAIVVPGAGVIGDCIPNQNALRRVLLAVRLWREQRAPLIVIAGGSGERTCAVAEAMARFAREMGVPEASVRTETASRSTRENAEFSAPLLRGWDIQQVLLVTDRLHMKRAAGVFRRMGFDVRPAAVPIYEGHDDNVSMLRAGLREYAALAYYRVRGWIGPASAPPANPRVDAVTPPPFKNPSGPIVLLGASYAAGWEVGQVNGVAVINRGVAGQQSFELLERFERDVVSHQPRAVILWGFINDIFRAPAGGIEPTLERIRDSYTQMIKQARANGIEPILATEVTARPRDGSMMEKLAGLVGTLRGRPSYQDQVNRHVLVINEWLTGLAAREGLLIMPFQTILADDGGRRRRQFAQPDGSHITAAGYDVLTAYATPVLARFLDGR
jgi:uncharacterized SAM-binding protein YcdF (DUF218 family)/lysophospholipase L1-like esterase